MVSDDEVLASGLLDFQIFPVENSPPRSLHGENGQGLLAILQAQPDKGLHEFLGKILAAVGMDLSKDALTLQFSEGQTFSFAKLSQAHPTNHALFFGIKPQQAMLNLNAPLYRPFTVGGISFLFAHDLSAIQGDPKLKRQLWEALNTLFDQ